MEMTLQEIRSNVNKLNGTIKADTTIDCIYPLVYFGAAD